MRWYRGAMMSVGGWLLGVAVGVAQPLSGLPGATMSAGQQYFGRYCSACHGMQGRGDGPVAASLRTPPADLTRIAQRRGGQFPLEEIAALVDGRRMVPTHGSREMPIWGEHFAAMGGGGTVGEEVVRGNLLVLLEYLQTLERE